MNNTVKRLIIFFVMIPLLTAVILFVPWHGHAAVILIITAGALACGIEMRSMLYHAAPPLPRWAVLIPPAAPLLAWAVNMNWLPPQTAVYALVTGVIWALLGSVFAGPGEIPAGFARMGSRLLLIMYPSFLLWWTARLTWFEQSPLIILIFMLTVYLNDSAAWLFGKLLGRRRGFVAVSPNKSLAGFIAGILTSVLVLTVTHYIVPGLIPYSLPVTVLFGFTAGAAVIAGDLVESALKRAVGVKDSGSIILGRGGMLDSIDSIILTAPVFVLFLEQAGL